METDAIENKDYSFINLETVTHTSSLARRHDHKYIKELSCKQKWYYQWQANIFADLESNWSGMEVEAGWNGSMYMFVCMCICIFMCVYVCVLIWNKYDKIKLGK